MLKIKDLEGELESMENFTDDKMLKTKEKLIIQDDRSRRNNIQVDRVKEEENESREATEEKNTKVLHDKLGVIAYIEQGQRVSKKESSNSLDNGSGKPRTIVAKLLDYKEKEEIM